MVDHRCPSCGANAPRGAGFCPACGTALGAPGLPFDSMASRGLATEHEVALGAGRSNPKRSALIVAVVAVVVIGAGLVVGSGGSGDDDDADGREPATTAAAPATTTDGAPRTTVERTTTTTAAPHFVGTTMPELAGRSLYAIVDDRVVRIDAATGEITVLGEGSRRAQEWSYLIPRAGGVVVASDSAAFFADDGAPLVDLGSTGGTIWPATDPAQLWVQTYEPRGQSVGLTTGLLVDVTTGETVGQIEIPAYAYPVAEDGAGGLLVQTEGGGIYAIDIEGVATRVSDGTFRAASPTHLVQFRCDEQLSCGFEVVNRATGEAVPVAVPESDPYPTLVPDPTGARVAVIPSDGSGRLTIVETATGNATEILNARLSYPGTVPAAWTADGQYLVWSTGVDLQVLAAGAGQPVNYYVRDDEGQTARMTAVAVGP